MYLQGLFDCLTGPCVTVPGVGKIQGSNKETQFSGRKIKGFYGIPFGDTTGGQNRFQPPKPRAPLNNGKDAFDASYLSYITNWYLRSHFFNVHIFFLGGIMCVPSLE